MAYFPILLSLVIAVVFSAAFVWMSGNFGPRKPTPEKQSVYECGMPPIGGAHQRFSVKFYLVAVLFILFDIETVFIIPGAVVFRRFLENGAGLFVLAEITFFLGVLFLGWVYVVKRGALDWE